MKRLSSLILALVAALSLTACGGDTGKTPSGDSTTVPVTSQTTATTTSVQKSGKWYDNGCYIEYISTYGAGPKAPGVVTDGIKYHTEMTVYYDGTKLLFLEHLQDDASGSFLYEKIGDDVVQKSSINNSGITINKTKEISYMNGNAGDYFFDEDKYGAHINDGQKMSSYGQRLYLFTKTDRKDTVAGRSCTIYEKVNESDASYTIEKWVDDELGIVLKTRDKSANAFDDYIWFEVQVLEFQPRTMPEINFDE